MKPKIYGENLQKNTMQCLGDLRNNGGLATMLELETCLARVEMYKQKCEDAGVECVKLNDMKSGCANRRALRDISLKEHEKSIIEGLIKIEPTDLWAV